MTTARTLEIVADSLAELKLTSHVQTVRQAAAELEALTKERDAELAELRKENGRLAGLKYALDLVNGRRVLRRHEAYLAAIDELEAFLKAAIERTENGEEMYSVAACQTASQAGVKGGEK